MTEDEVKCTEVLRPEGSPLCFSRKLLSVSTFEELSGHRQHVGSRQERGMLVVVVRGVLVETRLVSVPTRISFYVLCCIECQAGHSPGDHGGHDGNGEEKTPHIACADYPKVTEQQNHVNEGTVY